MAVRLSGDLAFVNELERRGSVEWLCKAIILSQYNDRKTLKHHHQGIPLGTVVRPEGQRKAQSKLKHLHKADAPSVLSED